jgi:transposase-like protein
MLLFMELPRTLLEAVTYFKDADNCVEYMKSKRWPDGVVKCPTCNGTHIRFDKKRRIFECNKKHPKRQFSVKVGTIFEDSPLGLDKWLPTVWMIANMKNGVSSHEIGRTVGVTQKTAWFMLHRVRLAMQGDDGGTLAGEVEVDETFIGGKARKMNTGRRKMMLSGRHKRDAWAGKAPVMGLLQRGEDGKSRIRTFPVETTRRSQLHPIILKNVEDGATIYTDALASYEKMGIYYDHKVIDHAVSYANGVVHTNGLENYWSLLKRGLTGTYVSVEPFHLFRYLDEQAFRFNERDRKDGDRFNVLMQRVIGKRLTYAALTAKDAPAKESL